MYKVLSYSTFNPHMAYRHHRLDGMAVNTSECVMEFVRAQFATPQSGHLDSATDAPQKDAFDVKKNAVWLDSRFGGAEGQWDDYIVVVLVQSEVTIKDSHYSQDIVFCVVNGCKSKNNSASSQHLCTVNVPLLALCLIQMSPLLTMRCHPV